MDEILEKEICEACGADIRSQAVFCYNCGAQVADDEAIQNEGENEKKISDAWFKEEIAPVPAVTVASAQKVKTVNKEKPKEIENPVQNEKTSEEKVKLRSAASLRDRSKLGGKKTVEIEWDEPKSAPNIWFLFFSLILVVFAAGILFAMIYIR